MEIVCRNEHELDDVANQLLAAHPEARIFALYGAMGAGKTTFVKAVCRHLNVRDTVQSPTFSIVNEYRTESGMPVYHFDFYRIRNISEVYDIGYEDYLYSGARCFLEWPELVENLLPEGTVRIAITGTSDRVFAF
jgi:tRNA threonylcarbamoyladenosine biosynthesis protein TsaE